MPSNAGATAAGGAAHRAIGVDDTKRASVGRHPDRVNQFDAAWPAPLRSPSALHRQVVPLSGVYPVCSLLAGAPAGVSPGSAFACVRAAMCTEMPAMRVGADLDPAAMDPDPQLQADVRHRAV